MTARTVEHDTFTIERTYATTPRRVFDAWSKPEAKARWFAPDAVEHTLDFRIGGMERNRGGGDPTGPVLTFESTYYDIVDARRIVFSSSLRSDGDVVTVSLTTVELWPHADGTHLLLTQHSAFLDGHEKPEQRRAGTRTQLEALAAVLSSRSAHHPTRGEAAMTVNHVLAVVAVSDFDTSHAWYQRLFDSPATNIPMPGVLAEWHVVDHGWLQMTCDPDRAGYSQVNFAVDDLAAHVESMRRRQLGPADIVTANKDVRLSSITDPDGNTITFIGNFREDY